jgi:hypothetical protein
MLIRGVSVQEFIHPPAMPTGHVGQILRRPASESAYGHAKKLKGLEPKA